MSLVAIVLAYRDHSPKQLRVPCDMRVTTFISPFHARLTARKCTMLREVFVLIAIVHFYYGIYYDLSYLTFPPAFHRGGFFDAISRLKYLTFWNMVRSDDYILYTNIV
jgi:hypothetical protein